MRVLRGVVYRMNSKGPRTENWATVEIQLEFYSLTWP